MPIFQIVQVQGLDSATVVGIAFAAFLIGVLLMLALWLIHKKTGQCGGMGLRLWNRKWRGELGDRDPFVIWWIMESVRFIHKKTGECGREGEIV